ncbi:MAG: hypothetical protein KME17_28330 [Cyanosarcina radialis HA8281-LM2]|jgi:hypothetical protein|nr:hypothetical protein [Cyanosarcina radialis HA8281-LM2]
MKDFSQMTDEEVKQYFFAHREDNEAFSEYVARRRAKRSEEDRQLLDEFHGWLQEQRSNAG